MDPASVIRPREPPKSMANRKKVGVLPFHDCINYGAYWQARCLADGLRSMGHDAVILDHRSWRVAMVATPVGSPYLRCACYQHAQALKRQGTPVQMVPEARVLHEQQPLIREHTRQGFDKVAAAWADPNVREARWLKGRFLVVFLFYGMDLLLDWRRLAQARKPLGLSYAAWLAMFPLFPFFRLIDVWGMLRALLGGPVDGGWGGSLAAERTGISQEA